MGPALMARRPTPRPQAGMTRVHTKDLALDQAQDSARRELARVRAQTVERMAGVPVGFGFTQPDTSATGTGTIPLDDTEPQNTEGTEFLTLDYTPKAIGNDLVVEASALISHSVALTWMIAALFMNAEAQALVANAYYAQVATEADAVDLVAVVRVRSLSPIRFRVRAGGHQAGTTTFNRASATVLFGKAKPSFLKVTEILT